MIINIFIKVIINMKRKSNDNLNNFQEIKLIKNNSYEKEEQNNQNNIFKNSLEKIIGNFIDIKILKKYINIKNSDVKGEIKTYDEKISNKIETENKKFEEEEVENKKFYKHYCKLNNDEIMKIKPLIEIIRNREVNKLKKIKSYPSDKKNNLGIFSYEDYFIRVDEVYDPFHGEMVCLRNLGNILKDKLIVLPFYVGIENGYYFSIQKNLKNSHTLYEWVRKKKLQDFESKILMCLKIGENISYLHFNNIVHGDIKPDNIMIIEEDGKVKPYLIDFGSAGIQSERLGTGGTKPYCYPKTENNEKLEMNNYKWSQIKKENDTWSLALIFLTLIITDELYYYYKDYPEGFFLENGYINERCFGMLPEKFREGFRYVLEEKDNICIDIFIDLLKK